MRGFVGLFNHLTEQGFLPATIVDVGVATDTEEIYGFWPRANYILVEPCVEFEPAIKKQCETFEPGRSRYFMVAAGAVNGETVIYASPDLGGSSIYRTIEADDGAYDMRPRTVPQLTLEHMWNTAGFPGPALLKIDVQGGEIEVLKGAVNIIDNFEVIITECNLLGSYQGGPLFHDMIAFLANMNFVLYEIIHYGMAGTGKMAELDLVFVKRDGQFRQDLRTMTDYSRVIYHQDYKGVKRDENL